MSALAAASSARTVRFEVQTDDPDIVAWLDEYPKEEWGQRATTAMRVGVLALRQASGFIDRESIRQEGKAITDTVERTVAETIGELVGPESDLLRLLDPKRTDGLVEELRKVVDTELKGSGETMLAAFDLNQPDSALSRLVRQVQDAQTAIRGDFTLDDPRSPLSRMLAGLKTTLDDYEQRNALFRQEVEAILRDMAVRKEAEARGTVHGAVFEDAVTEYVTRNAADLNDIAQHTGSTTGIIKNCKVGDCVIELGSGSLFAGERIVVEAKEDAGYDTGKALEEIDKGRRNRGADVGLFVVSKKTAQRFPAPLVRHHHDIIVVWDAEDPGTDVYLDAALTLARAMVFHAKRRTDGTSEVDFAALDEAIEVIAKRAANLEEVRIWASTIKSNSEKILAEVERAQRDLERYVAVIRDNVLEARRALAGQGG